MQLRHPWPLVCVMWAICLLAGSTAARGAVAVICNRSIAEVRFSIAVHDADKTAIGEPRMYSVPSNDLVVISIPRGCVGRMSGDAGDYNILPDTAYYFGAWPSGKLGLGQISLSTRVDVDDEPEVVGAAANLSDFEAKPTRTISVKIFVDEEEPARPAVWARRLRARVAAASEILVKHCGVGLEVVDVGTWESDDKITDFNLAVADFIKEADLGRARLGIGFTSQYQVPNGRTHLGGTRGPLQRHILLREWSQHISEPERLELLVHELGHHLGSAHSAEQDAVMRPLLGDRQARAKKFIVRFDPLNTLAMNLVAEEVRERGVMQFSDLSKPTKERLRAIYTEIAKSLPKDPAAAIYIRRLKLD